MAAEEADAAAGMAAAVTVEEEAAEANVTKSLKQNHACDCVACFRGPCLAFVLLIRLVGAAKAWHPPRSILFQALKYQLNLRHEPEAPARVALPGVSGLFLCSSP